MPDVPDLIQKPLDKLEDVAGGPARTRVIVILAAVMALESADAGTVGAVAPQLEKAFHIGNTEFGLLLTVSTLVGAIGSLPMGVLADRARRVRVLQITILLWAAAMAATGVSWSYLMMLLTRLGLGLVTAAAGPIVASLTGDLFPARERSRIYGMILTGELIGAGIGLVLSADIASFAGWRSAFFLLAVPSVGLYFAVRKLLPEPARGGQSWLRPGDEEIKPAEQVQDEEAPQAGRDAGKPAADMVVESAVRAQARRHPDIHPRPDLVVTQDPERMTPWYAGRYILRIPSNLVLIASSVLGYFFLAGLRSFAVLFAEAHYQISQAAVTAIFVPIGAGAILGTIGGGRLVDKLISRRRIDARVLVGGIAFVGASITFAPALGSTILWISVPLYSLAAAFLTTPNPALDAARLDVVPSRLWGRGEAVRTFGQKTLEAFAPLLFGYLSSFFGGPAASFGSQISRDKHGPVSPAVGTGLEYTFLIMLAPLLASGILLLFNRRSYLRDVATADLSDRKRWDDNGEPVDEGTLDEDPVPEEPVDDEPAHGPGPQTGSGRAATDDKQRTSP